MNSPGEHILWQERRVKKWDYLDRNGHCSLVLWFTGLPASGKSTLACRVEEALFAKGWYTYLLDGDNVRHGLNSDLGTSITDRREDVRRAGETARLFVDAGVVVLTAFASPFQEERDRVRALFAAGEFVEIYLKCDQPLCEARDPKGLYRKARAGLLPGFTGVDLPYEEPRNPELTIDTGSLDIPNCVSRILEYTTTLETLRQERHHSQRQLRVERRVRPRVDEQRQQPLDESSFPYCSFSL
ncbi:adenylyl-sulfate kinase [Geomonas sp. RF6]|uniref:adenylyl-sulfate kinase n=1 Tax=Geomonas sp. RF6 TaxID=2897342 RepID=UPI001E3AF6D4|nr:adenylyl-sulfate kinase [Geomonas sp. RF6]UFS69193.1 adenylyl-sulfate kinase [Geomonas sp. RF6]